jgi:hypothetical protein
MSPGLCVLERIRVCKKEVEKNRKEKEMKKKGEKTMKVQFKRWVLGSFGLFALMVFEGCSCSALRQPEFAQGQGAGLELIRDLDDRQFDLFTHQNITQGSNTEFAQLAVQEGVSHLNAMEVVSFTTDATLLGQVPLKGRSNFKYRVIYKLSKHYLKVYKVANKKDIPFQELSYALPWAVPGGEAQVGVPLVGYRIQGYYRVEPSKDPNTGEASHVLLEIPESDPAKATHVRVDYFSREVFDAVRKIDVFPRELFDGEWFFARTVVDVGASSTDPFAAQGFSVPYLIKFKHYPDALVGFDVATDARIRDMDDDLQTLATLRLNVEREAYEVVPLGNEGSMIERKREDVPKIDRPYIKVDFSSVSVAGGVEPNPLRQLLFGGSSQSQVQISKPRLMDLEIDSDYIGFTLLDTDKGVRHRYSFLRRSTQPDYEPRRYFRSDRQRFGFFTNLRKKVLNYEIYREEDVEKDILISRFNPNKEEIVFHFSVGSPDWAKVPARKAVKAWDQAFQLAFKGTGKRAPRIRLDEREVALGDLRYNVINLRDSLVSYGFEGRLLGFGPSLQDPHTGETISATTNIYIPSFRENLIGFLRNYILKHSGMLQNQSLISVHVQDRVAFDPVGEHFLKTRAFVRNMSEGQGAPPVEPHSIEPVDHGHGSSSPQAGWHGVQGLGQKFGESCQAGINISIQNLEEEIPTRCPEIGDYMTRLQTTRFGNPNVYTLTEEVSVLETCAMKLLPDQLEDTLLHEMGHNFGLRHNFEASSDAANFHTVKEAQVLNGDVKWVPRSSSVMDYLPVEEPTAKVLGKYDVAAIRFGYAHAVELQNGTLLNLDSKMSIEAQLRQQSQPPVKEFKYCTDGETLSEGGAKVLCQAHDVGSDAREVVEFLTRNFWDSFASLRVRLGRIDGVDEDGTYVWRSGSDLARYFSRRYFVPLKRMYDQWRIELFQERVKKGGSEAETAKYLTTFKQDNDYLSDLDGAWQGHWVKGVRDPIFALFFELLNLPDRYCVAQDSGGTSQLFPLKTVREQIYSQDRVTVLSCSEAHGQGYFGKKGMVFQGEVGDPYDDMRQSMDLEDVNTPFDVVGTWAIKQSLMHYFTGRWSHTVSDYHGFFPNMVDEPDLRSRLAKTLTNRVLDGVTVHHQSQTLRAPFWMLEKEMLNRYLDRYKTGLSVPNDDTATQVRLRDFAIVSGSLEQDLPGDVKIKFKKPSGGWVAALDHSPLAVRLLTQLRNLYRWVQASDPEFKFSEEGAIPALSDSEKAQEKAKIEEYQRHREEYQAQIELIKSILGPGAE